MSPRSASLVAAACSAHECLAADGPRVILGAGRPGEVSWHDVDTLLPLGDQYIGLVCQSPSPLLEALRRHGTFGLTVLPPDADETRGHSSVIAARRVAGAFVQGGDLYVEGVVDRTVERLGGSVLVIAGIAAAWQDGGREAWETAPAAAAPAGRAFAATAAQA